MATPWKKVTIYFKNRSDDLYRTYHNVAGVRETARFLVIRQYSFPNEVITKGCWDNISSYRIENEEGVE